MLKAVLFKSDERFASFHRKLNDFDISTTVLDFQNPNWLQHDFSNEDIVIYYPSFGFSSNSPLALQKVKDHIGFIAETWPHLSIYPDPITIRYYNDKYRQYLFLYRHGFPIPQTIPLVSMAAVNLAEKQLGFPMVIKNRYGAGGGSVFLVRCRQELESFFRMSQMDMIHWGALKYFIPMFKEKLFYWQLIKAKKMRFPFFSPPLIAQKYVTISRDLKTVVYKDNVVEAHWRYQADQTMWKMNIDGGGTGVWGYVPDIPIELSKRLVKALDGTWLNLDLIESEGEFLITEFSPVWHHYAYKEKPSFVYKNDYNLDLPLEVSLDLEYIIVDSLVKACGPTEHLPDNALTKKANGPDAFNATVDK